MRTGAPSGSNGKIWIAVIAAALGYFVDVFDIWLYSSVRKASLLGIGIAEKDLQVIGEQLLNWQMGGFILGAIAFGVIADKKGRLAVLFSSILVYSLANIGNAFAHDYNTYAICRFVAGFGLAGELGAGIALVSELVSTEMRGWATSFVATVGVFGSVGAPLLAKAMPWNQCYMVGGFMGIGLLILRFAVFESGLYNKLKERTDVKRGDFFHLFNKPDRLKRYFAMIFIGGPVWFFAGIMMSFSPELQKALGTQNPKGLPDVIAIAALGLCFGDVIFGVLSQWMRSRRKAFGLALVWMTLAVAAIYKFSSTGETFYWLMFVGGLGAGYWAVFVTTAGEVFGTNLRGTAATTAPSFVRGLVIPMTLGRKALEPTLGALASLTVIGVVVLGLAVWSLFLIPETFDRSMDFVEA